MTGMPKKANQIKVEFRIQDQGPEII